MRELGLIGEVEGDMFKEIESLMKQCKYYDYDHEKSDGSAVKGTTHEGFLSDKQFQNYLKLKKKLFKNKKLIGNLTGNINKKKEKYTKNVTRFLKEKNSDIQIIGAEPADGARIPGIRKWSPAFVPKIFDPNKVDQVIEISEEEARIMTKKLAKEEGVFAGMSGGGAVAAALKLAKTLKTGVIVTIIPDRGDRYLSSDLFE
jgi:threonine synthase